MISLGRKVCLCKNSNYIRKSLNFILKKDIQFQFNGRKLLPTYFYHSELNNEFVIKESIFKTTDSQGDKCNINSDKTQKSFNQNQNENSNNNNDNDRDDKDKIKTVFTKIVLWMFALYISTMYIYLLFFPKAEKPQISSRYISWNEFVHHMLSVGEVKELIIRPDMEMVTIILYDGAIVKGRQISSPIFHMAIADATTFEKKLRAVEKKLGLSEGISVSYDRHSDITMRFIITLLLFAIFMSITSRIKGFKNPISVDGLNQMGKAKFTLVDPFQGGRGVLFKDVAGLKEAKQEIREFVDYLKTPEKYQKLGAKVPRGALLLGPPGCGKTLLAKAVATEAQVPFLSMNGSEFIEMIGGLGAARVRDLFKEGKKRAPCIIYIDEIDAIGRQRSNTTFGDISSSGESEQTLNQLLVEMDGMASKKGVLMIASTNRPDILDQALLRPGRFDRHILIDLPTLREREEIFEKHLSSIQLEGDPKKFSKKLAKLTPGFSGADVANVCNEAALHAARNLQKIVLFKNLEYAVERLVGGTEKRSHLLTRAEKEIVAYRESGHALLSWLLPTNHVLLKITIVPRTNLALGFTHYSPSEQKLFTKHELFNMMCVALGGKAAENLIFKKTTFGAPNDLARVTKMAYSQITKFGMNDTIGPLYVADPKQGDSKSFYKPFSNSIDGIIDREVRIIVTKAYEKAFETLSGNREKLQKLAEALLEKETLSFDEIIDVIGPPVQTKK